MNITIKINTDNGAFQDCADAAFQGGDASLEVARILQAQSRMVKGTPLRPGDTWNLLDHNGNTVGTFKVSK